MRFYRKGIFVFLFAILLVGTLAACGGASTSGSDNATSDKESTGSNEASGSKEEVVTLKMIESLTSPARTELLKEMIAKFEEQNPGIKVELISPPLQSADQKITQMMMAKEALDVAEVRDQTVKQWSLNGFIEDLTPYTSKWEGWNTLTENAKSGATYVDNKPYFIPYGIYQKTLFFRKDWFAEAGISVPTTWEELYEAAKQLTDPSKGRYGYSFRGGAGASDYVEFTTWAYVGEKLNQKDGYFLDDGSNMFATPEAKQALEMFVKLYKDASPPDSISWSYPEMVQGFTSGVTAMLIQDPEVIITAQENMEEGTWGTAPLPLGPSGIAQQAVGTAGWGITSYSENKEEAWKLIAFLSSPEQSLYFAKNNSLIPIHTTAGDDPFFKEGAFNAYIVMNSSPDKYIAANRPVDYKGWGQYRGTAEKDIQALLLGQKSIDEVLDGWSKYWDNEKAQKQ